MSTGRQPSYITADQVRSVLTWPLVNAAVEEALKATGRTSAPVVQDQGNASFAVQPARSVTSCGERSRLLLTMPGYVGNYRQNNGNRANTLACKVVTSFSSNQNRSPPLPNILANILLFNTEKGELQSIIDGTQITAWRTASASVVATKYLYVKQFPEEMTRTLRVAIIGCGVQGQSHALGMCKTFRVIDICLWNRTKSKAVDLANKLKIEFPHGLNVHVCDVAQDAVRDADVICVGTYSPNALIDYGMLKQGNVHINTVGAGQVHFGEVAQDIYDNSAVYVDSCASAAIELKDLKATIVGEVGDVIRNNGKRTETDRVTIYQSMGIAAEDATVAQAVYDQISTKQTV